MPLMGRFVGDAGRLRNKSELAKSYFQECGVAGSKMRACFVSAREYCVAIKEQI
jgi:hypothetical protein